MKPHQQANKMATMHYQEWVTWRILYFRARVCAKSLQLCSALHNPMTIAHQAPLSLGFSRQEYWSGLPRLPPGDFPTQGSNAHVVCLLHWQAGSLPTSTTWVESLKRSGQGAVPASISFVVLAVFHKKGRYVSKPNHCMVRGMIDILHKRL